jgi:cyclin-dependent kinase 9
MAEMWTRTPILQGTSEQHQLTLISQLCGSITPEVWPSVETLELYTKMELPKGQKRKVCERLRAYVRDQFALNLLDRLLVLDPRQRIDADNALNHDFFWTEPMPADLGKMLSQHTSSMFEFLAPPRRGLQPAAAAGAAVQGRHPGGAPHPVGPAARPPGAGGTLNPDQHFDRVF